MKNRYEKFVLEAEKGVAFQVSEGTCGELIISAKNIAEDSDLSHNYANPPILDGYQYKCGKWNTGFVIERCSDGSQFVWIPVGSLNADGTLNGKNFSEKFGRRNFRCDIFSSCEYNENLSGELLEQVESVKKYGGFYISRYNISKSPEGMPQSIKGAMPWVNVSFYDAQIAASNIEEREDVTSHLTYGAEYDSVLAWLLKSNAKSLREILWDSKEWGNYRDTLGSPNSLLETGSSQKWCANNIYDLAGNVDEWTQEQNENLYRVIRGTDYASKGEQYPVSYRVYENPDEDCMATGFRAVLCIK